MHVTVAENAEVAPTPTVAVLGVTVAEASVGTVVEEIVMVTAVASLVTELSVPFTYSTSVPARDPAVNVTVAPVRAASVPSEFPRAQAYVVP